MPERLMYYVPIDYAESVGWAAVGWAHLKTAIDILLSVSARSLNQAPDLPELTSVKLERLAALARESGLREEWRIRLQSIADAAHRFREDFHNATHGTLYGRGVDNAALDFRRLHEKTQPERIMSRMTKAKIDAMSAQMASETRAAIALAMIIAETTDLFGSGDGEA